jgi:hypothetical protein
MTGCLMRPQRRDWLDCAHHSPQPCATMGVFCVTSVAHAAVGVATRGAGHCACWHSGWGEGCAAGGPDVGQMVGRLCSEPAISQCYQNATLFST